jgi:hypothetical protein
MVDQSEWVWAAFLGLFRGGEILCLSHPISVLNCLPEQNPASKSIRSPHQTLSSSRNRTPARNAG